MRAKLIAAALIMQLLLCHFVFAQQRGGGVRVVKTRTDGTKQQVQLYDGSYALVIGNSEYLLGWDRLTGVKSDVVAVRNVLEKHGFKVEVEENLTSEQFERRMRKFINDYGYDRNNRLLIYYAGHGYTLSSAGDKRELGYIVPSDTPLPTKDERGFRQKAISMYAIQTFAKEIQAKHALFVFDSCFSGKLFALRDTLKISPFIVDKVDYPVRQFITAGNETQTVPDESIFRRAFARALEGDADRNNDTYITGTELADYLKEVVTNYTNRRQTPQYGTINDIDLDRGDLVFVVPNLNLLASIGPSDKAKADSLAHNALVKMKSAELEEASELATEALFLDPEQALALAVRGHSREWLPGKKEYGQSAEDDLREAVRLEPYNNVYRAWLGNVLPVSDKEKKEILKLFAAPQNSLEYYALGINHLWLDGELTPFDQAISLEPKFTLAYFERGMLSADGPSNPKKAFDDMTVVIGSLPKDNTVKGTAFYIRAAMGSALNKDRSFVIRDFSKAIQILASHNENPYLIASYKKRAETFLKLGQFDEAINDFSILINLDKSSNAFNHYERAKVYFAKGDYQKAISDCTQAINISSDEKNQQRPFSGFYELRADGYEKISRKDLADADRKKAISLVPSPSKPSMKSAVPTNQSNTTDNGSVEADIVAAPKDKDSISDKVVPSTSKKNNSVARIRLLAFIIEFDSCDPSGGDVVCQFTLKNDSTEDKQFSLCHSDYRARRRGVDVTRAVDSSGNDHSLAESFIGTKGWIQSSYNQAVLVPQVPVRLLLRFANVSQKNTSFSLVRIAISENANMLRLSYADFKDVPITW